MRVVCLIDKYPDEHDPWFNGTVIDTQANAVRDVAFNPNAQAQNILLDVVPDTTRPSIHRYVDGLFFFDCFFRLFFRLFFSTVYVLALLIANFFSDNDTCYFVQCHVKLLHRHCVDDVYGNHRRASRVEHHDQFATRPLAKQQCSVEQRHGDHFDAGGVCHGAGFTRGGNHLGRRTTSARHCFERGGGWRRRVVGVGHVCKATGYPPRMWRFFYFYFFFPQWTNLCSTSMD